MASVMTIFSGKGGVGKSFLASNISCGLTMLNRKTILIDFAFGIRNDDAILGLTDSVLYNIGDVLCGECKLDEAIVCSDKDYIPDFLAASVDACEEAQNLKKNFRKIVRTLCDDYDFVVIDCTCCVGAEFDACCSVSDTLIAVTGEDAFSVGNTALRIIKSDELLPQKKYLLINKVTITNNENDVCVEDVIDEIGFPLIGVVPDDEFASKSLADADPLVRYSTPAGIELENVCRRLTGDRVSFRIYKKKIIFDKNKLILKNKQGGY